MRPIKPDSSLDDRLRRLLHRPQPPPALSIALRAQRQRQADLRRPGRRARAVAMAVALLVGTGLVWNWWTPADITAAYADTVRDRDIDGVHPGQTALWWRQASPVLPAGTQLDLAKDCWLGTRLSKHLRLRSAKLGTINLFMYQAGPADHSPWPTKAGGRVGDRVWALWQPLPGTTVLVLYEPQTPRAAITALLNGLLPPPPAA